mmetsp:Transcript_2493/g.3895  ORF Transcript_2493/g.3895 Transcript_2493/m.3895 type:complete len:470 (+) Transcript_2493:230-1639(+)
MSGFADKDAEPEKKGGGGFFGMISSMVENVASMNVDGNESDESYGDYEAEEEDYIDEEDTELDNVEVDIDKKYDVGKSVLNINFSNAPSEQLKEYEEKGYMGECPGETFQTRVGPNYNKTKKKAASAPAMLELMSADFVRTPLRVTDMGKHLNIPKEWSEGIDTHHPDIPPLFIVNAQIPHNWKTHLFNEISDGPCYHLILVYRVTAATAEALRDLLSAPPAVKLFAEYCMYGPSTAAGTGSEGGGGDITPTTSSAALSGGEEAAAADSSTSGGGDSPPPEAASAVSVDGAGTGTPKGKGMSGRLAGGLRGLAGKIGSSSGKSGGRAGGRAGGGSPGRDWVGRTKLTLRCENITGLKLPKFLMNYNGKPVLMRESGNLLRGDNYVELDINVKKFGMLACKTLPLVLARQKLMVLSIGFIVESREEEEMPEAVFGALRAHKATADPITVPVWFTKDGAVTKGKVAPAVST